MDIHRITSLAAVLAAAITGPAVQAADRMDLGKAEYESNCIACHGADGKGGPYVDHFLKAVPPDLTQLSKKNGGVFPLERIYAVIDGRTHIYSHGARDMPIWGREYQIKATEHYVDTPYDPESFVRGRILALIDYLSRLQDK